MTVIAGSLSPVGREQQALLVSWYAGMVSAAIRRCVHLSLEGGRATRIGPSRNLEFGKEQMSFISHRIITARVEGWTAGSSHDYVQPWAQYLPTVF